MADRKRPAAAARTAVVWELLRVALAERGDAPLEVVDVGGGTGGFAVPVAELGHRVTVIDPSPDSLAALERRAAEAGVSATVRGVQGDVDRLLDFVDPGSCDAVLCHSVLEYVDDPAVAVAMLAGALRAGGFLSVLAANRYSVVVSRALAGHLADALHALADPAGRWGAGDGVRRRFILEELQRLLVDAGLQLESTHGVRLFADLVPGALLESDPLAADRLVKLELAAAETAQLHPIAAGLHILATRPR